MVFDDIAQGHLYFKGVQAPETGTSAAVGNDITLSQGVWRVIADIAVLVLVGASPSPSDWTDAHYIPADTEMVLVVDGATNVVLGNCAAVSGESGHIQASRLGPNG